MIDGLLGREVAGDLDNEHAALASMLKECPEIAAAHPLAQEFAAMVRARKPESLPGWLSSAKESGVPELHGFALGLERDLAAVTAGLSSTWSNGQTEGQVNRLKLVKISMYGRARFDPLRQRVLTPI